MAKRARKAEQVDQSTAIVEPPVELEPAKTVEPVEDKPRRFMPRDCTLCVTRRKPGESHVRVYSKHGSIRYCRCNKCGNTWSQEGN